MRLGQPNSELFQALPSPVFSSQDRARTGGGANAMADIQRNVVTAREKARLRVLREAKEAEARSKGRFHFLCLKQAAAAEVTAAVLPPI